MQDIRYNLFSNIWALEETKSTKNIVISLYSVRVEALPLICFLFGCLMIIIIDELA